MDKTETNINDDNEITLRCNRCGKPITPATAVLTPTGYRCNECVRSQQKVFDTAKTADLPIGFVIAVILSFFGSLITARIGFFTILLAPAFGMLIAEAVRRAVKKRRSKLLFRLVLWGAIIGSLPLLLINLITLLTNGISLFGLIPVFYQGLFIALCASSAYYHLSGIRLR